MTLLLAFAGCSSVCVGPSCVDSWPAARLVVANPVELGRDEAVLAQGVRIDGVLAEGSDWQVLPYRGRLIVGMPDQSAVAVIQSPNAVQSLAALQDSFWKRPLAEAFGSSLALADTDGDGEPELWVGAPGYDGRIGAVYRIPDLDDPDPDPWDRRITGATPSDEVGRLIRGCGDLDGDGGHELVLGVPHFNEPGAETGWIRPEDTEPIATLAGAAFLLRSGQADPTATYPWEIGTTWWGEHGGSGAGRSVYCGRDITGDRRPDIALGLPLEDAGAGRIHLLSVDTPGGPLVSDKPNIITPRRSYEGWFGASLAVFGGEVGGVVVGSPGWQGGRGRVTIFEELTPNTTPEAFFTGPRDQVDHFGTHVTTANLDGDALGDLIVGAPDWRDQRRNSALTRFDTGRLWTWHGDTRLRWDLEDEDLEATHVLRGTHAFQRVGQVPRAADLNGDGIDELILPLRAPDPAER